MNPEEKETIINNTYDYSNIIATKELIIDLVKYLDQIYHHFLGLIEKDKEQNKKLKYELQDYTYKQNFSNRLEIKIMHKNYNIITCDNYNLLVEAVQNKQLENVLYIEMELNLGYSRGINTDLKTHTNIFKIIFKPYDITFLRKSNHSELLMDKVESTISQILNNALTINTIFCKK